MKTLNRGISPGTHLHIVTLQWAFQRALGTVIAACRYVPFTKRPRTWEKHEIFHSWFKMTVKISFPLCLGFVIDQHMIMSLKKLIIQHAAAQKDDVLDFLLSDPILCDETPDMQVRRVVSWQGCRINQSQHPCQMNLAWEMTGASHSSGSRALVIRSSVYVKRTDKVQKWVCTSCCFFQVVAWNMQIHGR